MMNWTTFELTPFTFQLCVLSLCLNLCMFYYKCKPGNVSWLQWVARYNVSSHILLFDSYGFVVWSVTRWCVSVCELYSWYLVCEDGLLISQSKDRTKLEGA